jgi:peptidoglycan hydrolase-like protein with peptidoglycan-binding domain
VAFAVTALMSTPALAAQSLGRRMLQLGMHGADVRTLQADLTYTGFATHVTGYFSRLTQSHVLAFQHRYRLSADGVVGPQTASTMLSVVGRARHTELAGDGAAGLAAQSASAQPPAGSTGTPTTTTTSTTTTTTPQPTGPSTGGTTLTPPPANSTVEKASLDSNGLAVAPQSAPIQIREIIDAANNIAFDPYVYGGGHQSFNSTGYDCSGSVSYALHGAKMVTSPLDSTEFESWGSTGKGKWITLWANGGHVYMEIAGLFFDTAAQSSSNNNDRWSTTRISPSSGFVVRHPTNW